MILWIIRPFEHISTYSIFISYYNEFTKERVELAQLQDSGAVSGSMEEPGLCFQLCFRWGEYPAISSDGVTVTTFCQPGYLVYMYIICIYIYVYNTRTLFLELTAQPLEVGQVFDPWPILVVSRPCLIPFQAWLLGKPWAVQWWNSRPNWGSFIYTFQLWQDFEKHVPTIWHQT
jgi:hypothetical protein